MTEQELMQARTNPEFLGFLEKQEKDALESKNLKDLYEVLDTLLILDLEEERVHTIYQTILIEAFGEIEKKLETHQKLTLEGDDFFVVRAFYEHAIEKWSQEDFDGAKELLFVLSHIIDDPLLCDAILVKLLSCSQNIDLQDFYNDSVFHQQTARDEKYGYFIIDFKFDTKNFLASKEGELAALSSELSHLLEVA